MSSLINCFNPVRTFIRKLRSHGEESWKKHEPDNEDNPSPLRANSQSSLLRNDGNDSSPDRQEQHRPPTIEIRKPPIAEESTSLKDPIVKTPLSAKDLTPSTTRRRSEASSFNHERNASRSRASTDGSATGRPLKDQLRYARVECPRRPHSFFVPKNILEELITVPAVQRDILAKVNTIGEQAALDNATVACECAKQLYAVLAYVKKGPDISSLLREGITDKALPLTRAQNDEGHFVLFQKLEDPNDQTSSSKPILTFESWDENEREKFDRVQWWMTAPMFEEKEHYELDEKTILPFVRLEKNEEIQSAQGAYSEVYPVRIHPAHHRFWKTRPEEKEPLVAIKKLFSEAVSEFEKERTILTTLGMKKTPHPHLIKLLASYRHKKKYHLMFPYADSNLRKYWEDRGSPDFDKATVLWSMKQMTGLADALHRIHMFRVTIPLKPKGGKRVQKDAEMSVRPGEELFGRHGDIKPENILWFQSIPGILDEHGILQIADFGLGRFHGRDSRSKVRPTGLVTSPTYEPPECKLHLPVSRAYDLWSMGCVYLEFITWLLKGATGIEEFADFRGELSSTGINDDNFFTVTGAEAAIRQAVLDWVEQLHHHEKCSQLIHNVLDLIMSDLLRIDSKSRCRADFLHMQMKMYLNQAEKDDGYMLKPTPHTRLRSSGGRSKSTSTVLEPPKPVPRRHPSEISDKILPLPSIPKSPILKAGGTAAGKKKRKSVTWPINTPVGDDG